MIHIKTIFLSVLAISGVLSTVGQGAPLAPNATAGALGKGWEYQIAYAGKMSLFDASGRLIGTRDNSLATGDVTLDLYHGGSNYSNYVLHGPGRHDLNDKNGRLIAYVLMEPYTPQEQKAMMDKLRPHFIKLPVDFVSASKIIREDEIGHGGPSGVTVGGDYAAGWDNKRHVYWFVRGFGYVQTTSSVGGGGGLLSPYNDGAHSLQQAKTMEAASTPTVSMTIDGQTTFEKGYGLHRGVDKHGHTVFNIQFDPPAP